MSPAMRDVFLMIADISGYTDFMLANEKSLEHSHIIISELIQTILNEVQVPLTLAKLEGDAVFLYAVKDEAFVTRAADLGARVLRFFNVFSNKVAELTLSSFCKCGACTNIEKLKLKVIVHSGRCAFYQIANLTELSGVMSIEITRPFAPTMRDAMSVSIPAPHPSSTTNSPAFSAPSANGFPVPARRLIDDSGMPSSSSSE